MREPAQLHGTQQTEAGDAPPVELRLYVAGSLPNSVQAEQNLRKLCEEHLPSRHSVEVVDFLREPERALQDGVVVTPTLLKLGPGPRQTIIGTLADKRMLLRALGLWEDP
jgi:circadian clock protein KaiB